MLIFPCKRGTFPERSGDPRTLGREAGRLMRAFGSVLEARALSLGEPVKQISSRLPFRCI